jgi:hypothetical protein
LKWASKREGKIKKGGTTMNTIRLNILKTIIMLGVFVLLLLKLLG